MKKKLTILVLVHPDLIPPQSVSNKKIFDKEFIPWKTEFDVVTTLKEMGHHVLILGLDESFDELEDLLDSIKIDLVFNLIEEYKGKSEFDYQVTDFLEKRRVPYTGCHSRALILGRDKARSKVIVRQQGVKVPGFNVFKKGKKINLEKMHLQFPMIVKCLKEESSYGLSKKSVVKNKKSLLDRIKYVHKTLGVDCIVEEFIEGDEVYLGYSGGEKGKVLSPRKLYFSKSSTPSKEIYTSMAKWSYSYARRQKISTRHFSGNELLVKRLVKATKIICESLGIDAQARVDFRVDKKGQIFFLEVNPNPNLAKDDDFALAALRDVKSYQHVIKSILDLALKRKKSRRKLERSAA